MKNTTLTPTIPAAADYQAAHAYLMSLKSDAGRAGMASALRKVARVMGAAELDQVNWATLNAANVKAIIAQIGEQRIERGPHKGERPAPATVTAVLNALKGTARAAWERIRSVKPPGAHGLPTGRHIEAGERPAHPDGRE